MPRRLQANLFVFWTHSLLGFDGDWDVGGFFLCLTCVGFCHQWGNLWLLLEDVCVYNNGILEVSTSRSTTSSSNSSNNNTTIISSKLICFNKQIDLFNVNHPTFTRNYPTSERQETHCDVVKEPEKRLEDQREDRRQRGLLFREQA